MLIKNDAVRYAIAIVWALFFVSELVDGILSGGSGLALVNGLSGLVGGVALIVYLRIWAARRARELAAIVASGDSVWAAQVRSCTFRATL